MKKSYNYLELIPLRSTALTYSVENNLVTLHIENKGFANRLLQLLLKKPKVTHIELDEIGSFAWQRIDGKSDITSIGKDVEARFGSAAHPTYERLAQFFHILEDCKFVSFVNK
jgi:hypothetical protein